MRNQRSFSVEFKRQVIQELLSGENRPAQLCRRHNISPSYDAGTLESLVGICKPYLDGVFHLTVEPYPDDLIKELKEIHLEHQP